MLYERHVFDYSTTMKDAILTEIEQDSMNFRKSNKLLLKVHSFAKAQKNERGSFKM